ncbi:hypothetical protein Q669_23580 [Labrenzia sp. C1B10]|nr:hypothetical protein Q669_23580 [Labrenzia sp. C1B10]ERS01974.1 hypothetical protein Q675_07695 [Labrenzia sp. C1B70]
MTFKIIVMVMIVMMVVMVMIMIIIVVMVVVVIIMMVMMLVPISHIVLGSRAPAEQNFNRKRAFFGCHHVNRRTNIGGDLLMHLLQSVFGDEISLVQNNEICATQLVVKEFFNRTVMIKSLVGGTLRGKCIFIKCDPAFGECCSIQHCYNTIYRYLRLDARPGEGPNERLRQSQARGFDNNMLRRIVPREQHFHGWQEIVGNGATYAAIGKLNHLFRGAIGISASIYQGTVEAHVPKLIDNEGNAFAIGVGKQIADQRSLACSEKPSDDRCRNFCARLQG